LKGIETYTKPALVPLEDYKSKQINNAKLTPTPTKEFKIPIYELFQQGRLDFEKNKKGRIPSRLVKNYTLDKKATISDQQKCKRK